MAEGTLSILDQDAKVYCRIWCDYEAEGWKWRSSGRSWFGVFLIGLKGLVDWWVVLEEKLVLEVLLEWILKRSKG